MWQDGSRPGTAASAAAGTMGPVGPMGPLGPLGPMGAMGATVAPATWRYLGREPAHCSPEARNHGGNHPKMAQHFR